MKQGKRKKSSKLIMYKSGKQRTFLNQKQLNDIFALSDKNVIFSHELLSFKTKSIFSHKCLKSEFQNEF